MFHIFSRIQSAESLSLRFYLMGYKGVCLPRGIRKLIAQSGWHRSWLSGHMGIYVQDGKQTSVCDREWYQFRKGKLKRVEPKMFEIIRRLIQPHAL